MEGLGCRDFGKRRPSRRRAERGVRGFLLTMILYINGEKRALPELATVADLVQHLGLPAATLLIEHNGVALRRTEWEAALLREGDGIELLRIAAGG